MQYIVTVVDEKITVTVEKNSESKNATFQLTKNVFISLEWSGVDARLFAMDIRSAIERLTTKITFL